jgi:3-hydroxy-3-methylglutaryl CoA synthase/uncharacterized OB-fold protein
VGEVVAYGAYVPYFRLDRSAIAAALGVPAGRGTRAVASYDEDTTSMGVEAARRCLAAAPDGLTPRTVVFATANPAYLDKTNATAIHAALGLPDSSAAYDLAGSVRSGEAALRFGAAAGTPTLVVLSDIRSGLPGSGDERDGGDGAAAFLFGGDAGETGAPPLVRVVAGASSTGEFLDRWRTPGDSGSRVWEERFGEAAYVPLAEAAITEALKTSGVTADAIDHLIVTGLHGRACRRVASGIGVRPEAITDDLGTVIGNTGTAHAGLLLADVLDRARPGQLIAVVLLADGADVVLLQTLDGLDAVTRPAPVAAQIAAGRADLSYPTFLTWRGQLRREPPRRPDPEPPAAPPSFRHERWKFGFEASRCEVCGTRHLPPSRVCVKCHAVDRMAPERLADAKGTIVTFTVDRLAFTLSPPVVAAVIDFDGGGRLQCELTDVDPAAVKVGGRVELTFRRLFTATNGVHNYFWKARPVQGGE